MSHSGKELDYIFVPCPETLWDAELKSSRPINLIEEISESPAVKLQYGYCCLLLAKLIGRIWS
jgi:hypothetical protein